MRRELRDILEPGQFNNVEVKHSGRMAAIRGRGNRSTEWRLRSGLIRAGLRGWVIHPKLPFGKPDFYFPERKMAIFVDGCFWHGCESCRHTVKKNGEFWTAKIDANIRRDAQVNERLVGEGFKVLRFWEHQLKTSLVDCINSIGDAIQSGAGRLLRTHPEFEVHGSKPNVKRL